MLVCIISSLPYLPTVFVLQISYIVLNSKTFALFQTNKWRHLTSHVGCSSITSCPFFSQSFLINFTFLVFRFDRVKQHFRFETGNISCVTSSAKCYGQSKNVFVEFNKFQAKTTNLQSILLYQTSHFGLKCSLNVTVQLRLKVTKIKDL